MKFKALTNGTFVKAIAATGLLMIAPFAYSAPLFTVNPDSIPGTSGYANFVADQISFANTSELVTFSNSTILTSPTATSEGWAQVGHFVYTPTSTLLPSSTTGLGAGEPTGYNLYLTYTAAFSLASVSGSLLTYDVTSLNYGLYADPLEDTTFTAASASGTGTSASISGGASEDFLLATGSVIPGSQSTAAVNTAGGVGINTLETVNLTSAGQNFFIQPVPFYQFAFDEFNNTSTGLGLGTNGSGQFIEAINLATGSVNFTTVPEPGTLALVGLSLLGMGVTLRRRKRPVA